MPSDVALPPNCDGQKIPCDIYIADMHHNRVRKVDGKTHLITTVAGSGEWGYSGDDGPATAARLSGPAGVSVAAEPGGAVTIFIADFYSGHVRAVGPDGIIRDVSDEGRQAFGEPTRVAFASSGRKRGWLYVADSSKDNIVMMDIRRIAPTLLPPRPPRPAAAPAKRSGG
jgi:hypothetical protein